LSFSLADSTKTTAFYFLSVSMAYCFGWGFHKHFGARTVYQTKGIGKHCCRLIFWFWN